MVSLSRRELVHIQQVHRESVEMVSFRNVSNEHLLVRMCALNFRCTTFYHFFEQKKGTIIVLNKVKARVHVEGSVAGRYLPVVHEE